MSVKCPLPMSLIVSVSALGVAGCGQKAAPTSPPATSVEIAEVQLPTGAATIQATGTVVRAREAALSFRIPGIMSGLSVDVGDRIRAGQKIAVLDARDAAASLNQSSAELAQAERDARRLEGLVDAGAVSRQQYDAARTRASTARSVYQPQEPP